MSLKAYKFQIYPDEEQKTLLSKHFGCARFIYNLSLAEKIRKYKEERKNLTKNKLSENLTNLKKTQDYGFLKEVNSQSLQSALLNLDTAFQRFFKKISKYPKFKKKSGKQSFACPQNCSVDFEKSLLFLPKFKSGIKAEFHRVFEGVIKTCTVSQNAVGQHFVSINVKDGELEKETLKPESLALSDIVGIDLGVKDFAVMSNGKKIGNPKHLNKKARKLARFQRKLCKSKKQSQNSLKRRKKVAKIHKKVANSRLDFLHKTSHAVVENQDYSAVAIENLNVKGMMKNRKLAKAIGTCGWGSFVRMLGYKLARRGKLLLKIGRFEPSSKTCSCCGNKKEDLTLADREWTCSSCWIHHDRDINAAVNIRNFAWNNLQAELAREPRKTTPVEEKTSGCCANTVFKFFPTKQEALPFMAG